MRRILALGCCALYLAFGLVAGAAHVHESAEHDGELQGLHIDHAHLGDSAVQGFHHGHESPDDGDARLDARHVGQHDDDVLYLSATAIRSLDAGLRWVPAALSDGATLDPPAAMPDRNEAMAGQPRDPPRRNRIQSRAPPA